MKAWEAGGKVFYDYQEAIDYANFIHKVSRIIVGVFEVKIEGV